MKVAGLSHLSLSNKGSPDKPPKPLTNQSSTSLNQREKYQQNSSAAQRNQNPHHSQHNSNKLLLKGSHSLKLEHSASPLKRAQNLLRTITGMNESSPSIAHERESFLLRDNFYKQNEKLQMHTNRGGVVGGGLANRTGNTVELIGQFKQSQISSFSNQSLSSLGERDGGDVGDDGDSLANYDEDEAVSNSDNLFQPSRELEKNQQQIKSQPGSRPYMAKKTQQINAIHQSAILSKQISVNSSQNLDHLSMSLNQMLQQQQLQTNPNDSNFHLPKGAEWKNAPLFGFNFHEKQSSKFQPRLSLGKQEQKFNGASGNLNQSESHLNSLLHSKPIQSKPKQQMPQQNELDESENGEADVFDFNFTTDQQFQSSQASHHLQKEGPNLMDYEKFMHGNIDFGDLSNNYINQGDFSSKNALNQIDHHLILQEQDSREGRGDQPKNNSKGAKKSKNIDKQTTFKEPKNVIKLIGSIQNSSNAHHHHRNLGSAGGTLQLSSTVQNDFANHSQGQGHTLLIDITRRKDIGMKPSLAQKGSKPQKLMQQYNILMDQEIK